MDSHLSWPDVAIAARRHLLGTRRAGALCPSAVLLRIGFAEPRGLPRAGELLPRLSTLTVARRYLSVALSLGSPPAAVSRYSCPVELGLSSDRPFRALSAAAQPARGFYCIEFQGKSQAALTFPHKRIRFQPGGFAEAAVKFLRSSLLRIFKSDAEKLILEEQVTFQRVDACHASAATGKRRLGYACV